MGVSWIRVHMEVVDLDPGGTNSPKMRQKGPKTRRKKFQKILHLNLRIQDPHHWYDKFLVVSMHGTGYLWSCLPGEATDEHLARVIRDFLTIGENKC